MWTFNSLQGESVNWYSEEEYNELKKENEQLKALLEARKVMVEFPSKANYLEEMDGEEE